MNVKNLSAGGLVTILLAIIVYSCATIDQPAGGRSDYDPPVPLSYSPENYSTNFKAKKIEVVFDERIKYKNLNKELVVSPPIPDILRRIKPSATMPTKKMEIDLSDVELLPNTTYTLNFGNSIGDNHEGTAIPNFKYVFSTGEKIDSLTVGGIIEDAFLGKFNPKTVVMLYRVDSTFNDSTVFKERPRYFTRLADEKDSTFRIDNIAPGTYQLIALVNEASNQMYSQAKDQIAFFPRYIELREPQTVGYRLRLARARKPYKVYQGVNQQKGLIQIAVDGLEPHDSIRRIFPELPDTARDYYLFNKERDTLRYWSTAEEKDSILFVVKRKGRVSDTINAKIRKPAEVEFKRFISTRGLELDGHVFIDANKPIGEIDADYVQLLDKDSLSRPFTLKLDSTTFTRAEILFPIAQSNNYRISVLPGAIKSILGEEAKDTARIALKTKSAEDYGTLTVNPVSFNQFPLIVQLISLDKNTVVKEATLDKPGKVVFKLVVPSKYLLRVIFDTNGNGRWDTVDYLKKQQPEYVQYMDEPVTIRPLWEEEIEW